MKRVEAEERGFKMYYLGKKCKWGHDAVRLTRRGVKYWKEELLSEYAFEGACHECVRLMDKNRGVVGESFEDIMRDWDPSAYSESFKYLPILSGASKMGYKVAGKTLVDTEWYKDCSKYLWTFGAKNYVIMSLSTENLKRRGIESGTRVKNYHIRLHRYIAGVSNDVPLQVDHINRDKLDNTQKNLRLASGTQNIYNSSAFGKVKYKGVTFQEKKHLSGNKGYFATLYRNKKRQFTKSFHSAEEAARYYDNYLRENFPSEFNVYNFPLEGELSALR